MVQLDYHEAVGVMNRLEAGISMFGFDDLDEVRKFIYRMTIAQDWYRLCSEGKIDSVDVPVNILSLDVRLKLSKNRG